MDSGAIKNHIAPKTVKQLRLPYKQKEKLYALVSILKKTSTLQIRNNQFKNWPSISQL